MLLFMISLGSASGSMWLPVFRFSSSMACRATEGERGTNPAQQAERTTPKQGGGEAPAVLHRAAPALYLQTHTKSRRLPRHSNQIGSPACGPPLPPTLRFQAADAHPSSNALICARIKQVHPPACTCPAPPPPAPQSWGTAPARARSRRSRLRGVSTIGGEVVRHRMGRDGREWQVWRLAHIGLSCAPLPAAADVVPSCRNPRRCSCSS